MLNYSAFDSSSLLFMVHSVASFPQWDSSEEKSERQIIEGRHAARVQARLKASRERHASSLSELKEQDSIPLA